MASGDTFVDIGNENDGEITAHRLRRSLCMHWLRTTLESAVLPLVRLRRCRCMHLSTTSRGVFPNKYTLAVARFVLWALVRKGAGVTVNIEYYLWNTANIPVDTISELRFHLQNGDRVDLRAVSPSGGGLDPDLQPGICDDVLYAFSYARSRTRGLCYYHDLLMAENAVCYVKDDFGDEGHPLERED